MYNVYCVFDVSPANDLIPFILFPRMESAYRAWIRGRRENSTPQVLDELRRELQTSLGTAKWQVSHLKLKLQCCFELMST